ncbi:hypothetical protein C8R31_101517 [Nitrosospira sp. Nsp2]|nr:hypothetical protein C8R31_101517 [Nitrosospira sp. Nsp2]
MIGPAYHPCRGSSPFYWKPDRQWIEPLRHTNNMPARLPIAGGLLHHAGEAYLQSGARLFFTKDNSNANSPA